MANETFFLRFGDLPSGKSECHSLTRGGAWQAPWSDLSEDERAPWIAAGYTCEDGQVYEPGISAFRLDDADGDTLVFSTDDMDKSDVDDLIDRPAILLTGRETGKGYSSEPLLSETAVAGACELVRWDRRKGLLTVRRTN